MLKIILANKIVESTVNAGTSSRLANITPEYKKNNMIIIFLLWLEKISTKKHFTIQKES